jgi:hypothetical protein
VFYGDLDGADGLAVWVFTPGQNSDAEWQRYCDAIRAAVSVCAGHEAPFGLQLILSGSSDPPPTWRREIALAADQIREGATLAVVTSSVVVRGMLTAISWIRAPKYSLHVVATLDEGLALADIGVPGRGARARATVERLIATQPSR